MKANVTFLIIFLMFINLFGQPIHNEKSRSRIFSKQLEALLIQQDKYGLLNGRKIPNRYSMYNINRHHINNFKKSNAQDGYGRPTEFVEQWWSTDQSSWYNEWREVYEYAQGYTGDLCGGFPGLSRTSSYYWSGTDWVEPTVTNYTYDSDWNITEWTITDPNGIPVSDGMLSGPYCCGRPTQAVVRLDPDYYGYSLENDSRYTNTFSPDCDVTSERIDYWDGVEWTPDIMLEYTYSQPGCFDSWVLSIWDNDIGEWIVAGNFIFNYGNPECMNDQVPYPPSHIYPCNPTSIDVYISFDNGDTWEIFGREEFILSADCQTTSQYTYIFGFFASSYMITNVFSSDPGWGKILEIFDNSDTRVTESVSQLPDTLEAWENNWRALYSYEGTILDAENEQSLPNTYLLAQNYPNPFNPYTTILYELPEQTNVSVVIYDFLGREINVLVNNSEQPGYHSVIWNGKDASGNEVSAGIYLSRIQAGQFIQTKKMVLLK